MVFRLTVLVLATLLLPGVIHAQEPCDASCDHVIDPASRLVDGAAIGPGDTVCIRGGTTQTLSIRDVRGSADAPVLIRACDAPLEIGGGSSTNGISIQTSSHLRITGGHERSIRIVGGPTYSVGVAVNSCTEHLEVDGLEVSGTTYTAYRNLSESVACPVRTGFSLHHWYIHDVGGEGMFFGANVGSSPYRLVNVEVYANRVERTGMQGIKIGTTVDDAHVHHNWVIDAGTREIGGEDTGITGSASTFIIEHNIVLRSSRSCIFAGGPDLHVTGNLLLGCGDAAMSTNGSAPTRTRILHNTMIGMNGAALNMWASNPTDCAFANNLVVDLPEGRSIGITDGATWRVTGNLTVTSADAGFASTVDLLTADFAALSVAPFALAPGSMAIDAASTEFLDEVSADILGVARDAAPDIGAHEWAAPMPDAGVRDGGPPTADTGVSSTDAGAPRDAARSDAGAPEAMGGCTAGASSRSGLPTLFGLLLLSLARLGRRSATTQVSPPPALRRQL
jgi:hypothetical protein